MLNNLSFNDLKVGLIIRYGHYRAIITKSDIASYTITVNTTLNADSEISNASVSFYGAASGEASHIEGYKTIASGVGSHAEGECTIASGKCSHTEGWNTTAIGLASHVEGKNNIIDYDGLYAHIVGNGISDTERSNVHTLDWSGNVWYSGDVYVGSASGINRDEGSKKLATEEYVNSLFNNKDYILTESDKMEIAELVVSILPVYGGEVDEV